MRTEQEQEPRWHQGMRRSPCMATTTLYRSYEYLAAQPCATLQCSKCGRRRRKATTKCQWEHVWKRQQGSKRRQEQRMGSSNIVCPSHGAGMFLLSFHFISNFLVGTIFTCRCRWWMSWKMESISESSVLTLALHPPRCTCSASESLIHFRTIWCVPEPYDVSPNST